jgi:hypothetical protein
MRADIPHLADAETQEYYLAGVRGAITSVCKDPELLAKFLRYRAAMAKPNSRFGLPWSAMPDTLPKGNYTIRVLLRRKLRYWPSEESGSIDVACNGREYRFHEASAPVFQYLFANPIVSSDQLFAEFRESFGDEQVRGFLLDLVQNGLVACESP